MRGNLSPSCFTYILIFFPTSPLSQTLIGCASPHFSLDYLQQTTASAAHYGVARIGCDEIAESIALWVYLYLSLRNGENTKKLSIPAPFSVHISTCFVIRVVYRSVGSV
ncbi:hypothetical protein ACP275_11G076300 [Erythranthe tilingii]